MKTIIPVLLLVLFFVYPIHAQIEKNFVSPPESAQPHAWFHWMNGNITKSGITSDIEAMKQAGIGGYYIFDIGWGTPPGPYPYASEGWLDMVAHCSKESERTGVKLNFHNCSGWSSTGGPWVTAERSMKWIVWTEAHLTPDSSYIMMDEPQPIKGVHDKSLKDYNRHKKNRFYKDIIVLAFPTPQNPYRIKNWERKGLSNWGDSRTRHFEPDTATVSKNETVPLNKIIDISEFLKEDGTLEWLPELGKWTVIRFGYSSNGIMNRPASNGGGGLEIDKLDPEAVELHWNAFLDKVVVASGGKGTIHEMLIDSYETGVQNWTRDFEHMFKMNNTYDIIPYLPCIAGYTVGDVLSTERFLWDLRSTVRDLMHQNYFEKFKEKCHENNMLFVTEPYGKGPFDAFEVSRMSEIPIGEFWYPDEPYKRFWKPWSAKIAASGAHLSGRRIVGAEAFTSWNGDFKQVPSDLKPVMDKYYTLGINRNIFHTYAHQPWHNSVKPGMTMHRFGLNFHRNNTWFAEGREFFTYMSRCQYIFQSGTYMADVLILYGDERGFYNLGGTDTDQVFLQGHNYDFGNMNVLNDLSLDENGDIRVTYQGKLLENRYKMILVQFGELMQIENIKRLGILAEKGAEILAPRPKRSPGLKCDLNDAEYEQLVNRYWDKGLIISDSNFNTLLMQLTDDCEAPENILFNHTKIKNDDYYFVVNTADSTGDYALNFRVYGKQPEIWDPMNGSIKNATNWQMVENNRTEVIVSLPPHASRFIVFRNKTDIQEQNGTKKYFEELQSINGPWTLTFYPQWGIDGSIISDTLFAWNSHTVEDVKYYSGTATYSSSFNLEREADSVVILDLGNVCDMARVRVNGKEFPLLWHKPFILNVSGALKQGENMLEVDITNSWNNRLVGDSHISTTKGLPDWITNGNPLPDSLQRKTWVFHQHQKKDESLSQSGLLGPVHLYKVVEVPANL